MLYTGFTGLGDIEPAPAVDPTAAPFGWWCKWKACKDAACGGHPVTHAPDVVTIGSPAAPVPVASRIAQLLPVGLLLAGTFLIARAATLDDPVRVQRAIN